MGPRRVLVLLSTVLLLVLTPSAASAHHPSRDKEPQLLASGLSGGFGQHRRSRRSAVRHRAVGRRGLPDRPAHGRGDHVRVRAAHQRGHRAVPSAARSTWRSCGGTAYALVDVRRARTSAGTVPRRHLPDRRSEHGPRWSSTSGRAPRRHPPTTDVLRRHRRAVRVRAVQRRVPGHRRATTTASTGSGLDGSVSRSRSPSSNIVPTGSGRRRAGASTWPRPARSAAPPADGKIVTFGPRSTTATEVAVGRTADGRRRGSAVGTTSTRSPGRLAARRPARAHPRRRTPGSCSRSAGTVRSRSSPTAWTSPCRSRSSAARPTSSRSAGRCGRSTSTGGTATADLHGRGVGPTLPGPLVARSVSGRVHDHPRRDGDAVGLVAEPVGVPQA